MSAESIKLELMVWIGNLTDTGLLKKLYLLKEKTAIHAKPIRKPGWGKDIFLSVAPDFDATPEGFEEYMPSV